MAEATRFAPATRSIPTLALLAGSAPVCFGVNEVLPPYAWMPDGAAIIDAVADFAFRGTELGPPGLLGDGREVRAPLARRGIEPDVDGRSRDQPRCRSDGPVRIVTHGYHPFVTGRGADAYYLNALAGDHQTMARSFDPDLEHVRAAWATMTPDPRVSLVDRAGPRTPPPGDPAGHA